MYFHKIIILLGILPVFLLSQVVRKVPQQYPTIQSALNAAQSGDTVLVQPGLYKENIIWPNVNGIKLLAYGNAQNTIIDGGKIGSVITIVSNYLITAATEIKGFSITNGANTDLGGGICISNADPTIAKVIIVANSAKLSGGGIFAKNCRMQISDSEIRENSAPSRGGGIYVEGDSPIKIVSCLFKENQSNYGGGIFILNSSPTISNSIFQRNSAWCGAGIAVWGGSPLLEKIVAYSNTASSEGGAIWGEDNFSLVNSSIIGNVATTGGGISIINKKPKITKTTFYQNQSIQYGDAINVGYIADPEIMYNNFLGNGFGLYNSYSAQFILAPNNWWGDSTGPCHVVQNPNGKGDSTNSLVNVLPFLSAPDTTASPLPIDGLRILNVSGNSISITWNKSQLSDLQGYKVYWDTNSIENKYNNFADVGNVSNYSIRGLTAGITYHLSITCYDRSGNESWYAKKLSVKTVPPILKVVESTLGFPNTAIGDSAAMTTRIVSGNASLLNLISFSNKLSEFRSNILLPASINGFDTLKTLLVFKPSHFGTYDDTVSLASTGGSAQILLSGVSPFPSIISDIQSINLGTVVRNASVKKVIKLTNTSINTLKIDSMFTNTRMYSVSPKSGMIKFKDTLAITISFNTDNFGLFADTLFIRNNSLSGLLTIPLMANSPFQVVFNGATLNYVNVAIGDSTSQTLLLGNIFNGPTTIDSIYTKSSVFKVNPSKAFLNTSDTLPLQIKFKPTAFQNFIDTVYLVNTALSTKLWIALSGSSPSPNLLTNVGRLNFDSAVINVTASKFITFTNTSINNLQIKSVLTKTTHFSCKLNSQSTIVHRGDSLSIQVDFRANALGNYADTLLIENNSNEGTTKIPIVGIVNRVTAVDNLSTHQPIEYVLYQNYPNPFNPSTLIKYGLPKSGHVKMTIYNLLGKEVVKMIDTEQSAGYHEISWDGSNLPSGIYFYRMQAGGYSETKRLMLLK